MPVLEIYIHFPFCVKKCRYCDFLSFQGIYNQYGSEYFAALKRELEHFTTEESVSSVFIGGGTPGLISTEAVQELMETVRKNYRLKDNCEVTIETNPGIVDKNKLRSFRESGINRLSLGVQSLDDNVLKAMGRIHSSEDALKAYNLARNAGFENINTDLILGYPGQSFSSFKNTLNQVLSLEPEHISAYSLIVEEGTALYEDIYNGKIPHPDDDEDRKMYEFACETLEVNGYERYEISNFAKNGRESVHNLGYWMGVPYLGVGLGAASFVDGVRYKNITNLNTYISVSPDNMRDETETEVLTEKELMDEYMMLGFRLKNGPDPKAFMERFGKAYSYVYREKLEKLRRCGFVEGYRDGFRLTEKGLDMGNVVFGEFV